MCGTLAGCTVEAAALRRKGSVRAEGRGALAGACIAAASLTPSEQPWGGDGAQQINKAQRGSTGWRASVRDAHE